VGEGEKREKGRGEDVKAGEGEREKKSRLKFIRG
jgi:hypothetical protein